MVFRRIDNNTINCIITEQDLSENGIELDDLFERKKEAMDYLKGVIIEAAQQENFSLEGQYTSMRISILPDHSVSLTISEGNDPAGAAPQSGIPAGQLKKIADSFARNMVHAAGQNSGAPKAPAKTGERDYGYLFHSMNEVAACCRELSGILGTESSLYEDGNKGDFVLILSRSGDRSDTDFEKQVLSFNEFGTFLSDGPEKLAYIREHWTCILKTKAVETLAAL